jgi:DNA-binding response OmpR family regulator/Tfp pilus assembly protein PilZ
VTITCEFPDKIRFIEQVFRQGDFRLFVPTEEPLRPGMTVDLQIVLGDDEDILTAHAKIAAVRTQAGAAAPGEAGVWVQLDPDEAAALRQSIEFRDGDALKVTVRVFPRYPCALRVLIEKPIIRPARAMNISQGGLCLRSLLPTSIGQTVYLTVEFVTETIAVYGKVIWRRDDLGLTGVQFRFQNDQTRQRLAEQVRRLATEAERVVYAQPSMLLVDDDHTTLRALQASLSTLGYGAVTASSGPEALALARECRPALILLDVLLHGMNGVEVCRVLRRDAQTSKIPVILMSGLPHTQLGVVLREAGALVALPKPYRVQALERLVQIVLDYNQSLLSPKEDASPEARDGNAVPRSALFLRGLYHSETLRVEGYLRDISNDSAFLTSTWGDTVGSQGGITIIDGVTTVAEVEVQVTRRSNWGVIDGEIHADVPGMGLRFLPGKGRDKLEAWLSAHARDANKPVVVVVDDDRAQLEIMSRMLEHAGITAVTLDSPFGVTNAIAYAKPSLVILDFMMPGLDGIRLAQILKADSLTRHLPIWLCSSLDRDHLQALTAEAGADDFIQKGTRPTEIIRRIRELLGMPQPAHPRE